MKCSKTDRYSYKDTNVKAARWIGKTENAAKIFCISHKFPDFTYREGLGLCIPFEGTSKIVPSGFWIVQNNSGHFEGIPNSIFRKQYEAIN